MLNFDYSYQENFTVKKLWYVFLLKLGHKCLPPPYLTVCVQVVW